MSWIGIFSKVGFCLLTSVEMEADARAQSMLALLGIVGLNCPMGRIRRGHLFILIQCERLKDQRGLETELKKHPLLALTLTVQNGVKIPKNAFLGLHQEGGAMKPSSLQLKDN